MENKLETDMTKIYFENWRICGNWRKKIRSFYISVFMKLWIRNTLNKLNLMTPQDLELLSRIPSCNQHQQLLENWDAREKKNVAIIDDFPNGIGSRDLSSYLMIDKIL